MDRLATVTAALANVPPTRPVLPVPAQFARPVTLDSPVLASVQNKPMPPELVSTYAIEDLDILLEAVRSRLHQTATNGLPLPADGPDAGLVSKARVDVLDCVAALEQLHSALIREVARGRELEMTVFDTRTALARLRGELAGTLAGERQARHLAMHDNLTSLHNRGYFRERLSLAVSRATTNGSDLAVIYLDLDGFKEINDQHGHAVGDEVLRIIAARLTRAVRVGDTVARLGGDEFGCLLMAFHDRAHLSRIAGKLFDAISAPLTLDQLRLSVRPSIGISLCPAHGATAELLLASADAAMYDAKRRQCGHAFGSAATTPARTNGGAAGPA